MAFPGRRVASIALACAMLVLAGCTKPSEPTPSAEDEGGGRLDFIASTDGVLDVTLVARESQVTIGGKSYSTVLYNDQLISPIWRVWPGDTIHVNLQDLRPSPSCKTMEEGDHGAYPDYTNLHFHGFNVRPQAPSDDVFVQIYPKASGAGPWSYNYTVVLPPSHPQGLFWFHPHPHGVSTCQVMGGMSGVIIVGDILASHYPQFKDVAEQLVLLRDFSPPGPYPANATAKQQPDPPVQAPDFGQSPILRTINGDTQAEFSIAPGETQFWRFANIGANLDFNVAVVDADNATVPGLFEIIAVDGNVLDKPAPASTLFLHPGGRLEVLVRGPQTGTYQLVNLETQRSVTDARTTQPWSSPGTVVSQGSSPGSGAASFTNPDPQHERLLRWLADGNATVPYMVTFNNAIHNSTAQKGINGKPYDVHRNDTTVEHGSVGVWTIANPTAAPHVFHIHQLDFLVTQVDDIPYEANGLQDTIRVPAFGSVEIVIPFTEPWTVGRFVYHCHYLPHEDRGMMANIVVTDGTA